MGGVLDQDRATEAEFVSRRRPVAELWNTLSIGGLTGLLAALTTALLAGGYATVRRLTV